MTYRPISCAYYDELEALATLRHHCVIDYLGSASQPAGAEGIIVDFFIRDKAEYLRLDSGLEIRLDCLLSVNGKALKDYC
jgi:Rho-binding antiterminator